MSSSILSVGQSALTAAQAGLTTTGHNIANANTPGYTRQLVVQASAGSQNSGFGFLGKGTSVVDVRRVYNELLAGQVRSAQSSQTQVETYYTQISRINNQLADTTAGLSPVLQDFFKGVQDLASNPNAAASRQSALSSAEALAARFQSLDGQLKEVESSVNAQIETSITSINVYAQQIAKLNDAIEKAQGTGEGKVSNDLLDQRDQAINELSKEIKTTVVKQGNSYNVFIGNGQPLVVGAKTMNLVATASETDPTRMQVGYQSNGKVISLSEDIMTGGKLGGLFEFRSNSMDVAQNSLGRIAIGLAMTFNAQHRLGMDQNGALGGDFFVAASPRVDVGAMNNKGPVPPAAVVTASITDASKLTTSDYRVQMIGANYVVTRMSDNVDVYSGAAFPGAADQAIPGVTLSMPTAMVAGDEFVIRPTVDGAANFAVAIKDVAKVAAAAPIRTAAPTTNTGTGKISPAVVSSTVFAQSTGPLQLTYTAATGTLSGLPANQTIMVNGVAQAAGTTSITYTGTETINIGGFDIVGVPAPASPPGPATTVTSVGPQTTLTYDAATQKLTGFSGMDLTVKHADGTTTSYTAAQVATANGAIAYTDGDTFTTGGVSYTITGAPSDQDKFTISYNGNGVGDSRNAVLLGALQSKDTLGNKTTNFQGAYAQLVSVIGNKTRELEVTSKAETSFLEQAVTAQEAESGVNLDEEATNLLRYQQAYQAAAKVMQTANQLFDLLLNMGG